MKLRWKSNKFVRDECEIALSYVKNLTTTIALPAKKDAIVVTKSTVPVGTKGQLRQIIDLNKLYHINDEIELNLLFINEVFIISDFFHSKSSSPSRFIRKLARVSV